MLRQALDAAQGEVIRREPAHIETSSQEEINPLLSDGNGQPDYYTSTGQGEDYDNRSAEEIGSYDPEDGEFSIIGDVWDDDEDDENSIQSEKPNLCLSFWKKVKSLVMVILNVENLWDSPDRGASRKNHLVVLFWFFILATSYAFERSSFKLLVDHTGPFRLFMVEMVTFTHAFLVGLGMVISAFLRQDFKMQPLGIPIVDVGLMALLDTVHILLVYLTGLHVAPTLTVILVQFTLPLTALLTQFIHPDGCCTSQNSRDANDRSDENNSRSPDTQVGSLHSSATSDTNLEFEGRPIRGFGGLSFEHILGSVIISMAVFLALCPSIYSIMDPDFFVYADAIPLQTAYNTLLFVTSCIPAAASQLYKEHIFLQYKQPVQADYLNFILSAFQFIFASIMSPLVFTLQGFGAIEDWTTLYPSSSFSRNYMDGLQCYFNVLDKEVAKNGYDDDAECEFAFPLVMIHAFSIIAIGVAVDKIVNAGATKVMYRGVSAGIILAVTCLYEYDMHIPEFSYGALIDSFNLVCLLLLVVGSEVYHRVSLTDSTFQTVYPEIENYYDEE